MFNSLKFWTGAASFPMPVAARNSRVGPVFKSILMSIAILTANAQALEPYDSSQATHWPGVELIPPETAGIGRKLADVAFFELQGKASSLYRLTGNRGTVIVVRDPECPVSVRYGPRIAAMARDYSGKGFSFAFIYLLEFRVSNIVPPYICLLYTSPSPRDRL